MSDYTESQKKVVDTLQGNMLVSASAGSGKTRVLVGRVLNILQNKKATLQEMLVVTFTESAGEEMKDRIRQKLIDKGMFDEAENLSSSDIMNLHKFCNKLLRQYFYEVGLDPNYKVLDDTESEYIMLDVLEECLEEYLQDPEYSSVLEAFYGSRQKSEINKTILYAYKFLLSLDNKQEWLQEKFSRNYEEDFENILCLNYIKDEFITACKDCLSSIDSLSGASIFSNISEKTAKLLDSIRSMIVDLINVDDSKSFFQKIKQFQKFPTVLVKNFEGDDFVVRKNLSSIVGFLSDEIKQIKGKLDFDSYEEWENAIKKNGEFTKKIINIVQDFATKYENIKKQKNVVDFSDLEEKTLQILSNEEIRKHIQSKYKYIFIDEYQDTNDVQEKILSLITTGDNLFMVGDLKQSIYAFRGCSPQIFMRKLEDSKNENSKYKCQNLNENFRSRKDILEFSNYIFENIMKPETAKIDYKNTSSFVYGQKYKSYAEKIIPSIEVVVFDKKKDKLSRTIPETYDIFKDEKVLDSDKSFQCQAHKCVEIIKKALAEKIYDDELQDFRNVEYKDIAILTRNKKQNIEAVSRELNNYNIPYSSTYNINLYSSTEIQLLLNYLRLIDNSFQDIPLVSILKSYMFNLDNQDLAEIRIKYPDSKFFYESCKNYAQNENDEISKKLNKFYGDINEYRIKQDLLNVRELIVDVINKYNYQDYCLSGEEGLEKAENLSLFIKSLNSSVNHYLNEFLNYIDEFASEKSVENNVKTGSNAVTIMTIHKSKGLEFPIVILVDCGKDFSSQDSKKQFVMEKDLGYASKFYDSQKHQVLNLCLDYAIKEKIAKEQKEEEMRLLYVALTRAKNNLYVLGDTEVGKLTPINSNIDVVNRKNYISWILGVLDEHNLDNLINQNKVNILKNGCSFKFCISGYDDFVYDEIEIENNSMVETDLSSLKTYLEFKPQKSNVLLKNTVTRLQENDEKIRFTYSSTYRDENEDVDYLLIGTVYHKALEKLNFESQNLPLIENEYQILLQSNLFSSEEKNILEKDKVFGAINVIKPLIEQGDRVYKEKSFYYRTNMKEMGKSNDMSNFLVQGVVDLMIEKQDSIILIDYKTSRLKKDSQYRDRYGLQLELYSKSIEDFFGKKVSQKFIYSFYLDKLIIV